MAEFENNNVEEVVEDELENTIITLTDEETGAEEDFELYARVTMDGNDYFALIPCNTELDEYVILRATVDGEDLVFETIEDDEEFEKVEDYFNDLLMSEVDYDEN